MVDIAKIQVEMDTRDLKSARRELDRVGDEGDRTERRVNRATRSMSQEFGTFERTIRVAQAALAALALDRTIRQAIEYSDANRQINNQLRLVTESERELTNIRDSLVMVSKNTNAELDTTVRLYAEMYRSTRELNVSQQDVVGVTETINNLFKAGGRAASETAGAVRQLTQGLAAGALRGDEFNSVAEGAPRILDAIAQYTNIARGELRDFAAEGGITSEILINSLRAYSEEAQEAADQTDALFGQKMVNARTNIIEYANEANNLNAVIGGLGDGIEGLTENLEVVEDVVLALAAIFAARFAGSITVSGQAMLVAQIEAARYQATLASMAGVSRGAAAAQLAFAGATRVATGAMALVGGPVGVAVLAAAGIYAFREELRLVDTAARDTERAVSDLGDEIAELDRKATMASIAALEVALSDLQRQAKESQRAVSAAVNTQSGGNSVLGFSMDMSGMKDAADNTKALRNNISFVEQAIGKLKDRVADLDDEESRRAERQKARLEGEQRKILASVQLLREQQQLVRDGMSVEEAAFAVRFNHANALEREQMLLQDSLKRTQDERRNSLGDLEDIRQRFMTEQELLREKVDQDAMILADAREAGLLSQQEHWELQLELKQWHEDELTRIERDGNEARKLLDDKARRDKEQAERQMWTDLGSLMNSESRKMFEIGKAAAIADTIITTYRAANTQFAALSANPPLAYAAAAAAVAAGMARVQAIQSTSFGSKTGGGVGGSGSVNGQPTSAESAPARTVTIKGIESGALFTGRQLIDLINEAQEDGARLVINDG